jgi:hypothetical protein
LLLGYLEPTPHDILKTHHSSRKLIVRKTSSQDDSNNNNSNHITTAGKDDVLQIRVTDDLESGSDLGNVNSLLMQSKVPSDSESVVSDYSETYDTVNTYDLLPVGHQSHSQPYTASSLPRDMAVSSVGLVQVRRQKSNQW